MKVTVAQKNLRRALAFCERIAARNTSLPILANTLLKTENGRLRISATNLEVGIHAVIGARVEGVGEVAVPARILSDVVNAIGDDALSLLVSKDSLIIHTPSLKTTILCQEAKEYPIIPKITTEPCAKVESADLASLLGSVIDSVALSESRPELAGMYLRLAPKEIIAAATDSFRLVERRLANKTDTQHAVIVPRATVAELLRLVSNTAGEVAIRIGDNQIAFTHDEFELISRLVDGRYPDYTKVIPEKTTTKVIVGKEEFEKAIRTAALFSSSIADIKLACHGGMLTVTARNSAKGEAEATVPVTTTGEEFELSLNHAYFLDGLKIIPTENVVLEYTGKGTALILRPEDGPSGIVYLIMPLRA